MGGIMRACLLEGRPFLFSFFLFSQVVPVCCVCVCIFNGIWDGYVAALYQNDGADVGEIHTSRLTTNHRVSQSRR